MGLELPVPRWSRRITRKRFVALFSQEDESNGRGAEKPGPPCKANTSDKSEHELPHGPGRMSRKYGMPSPMHSDLMSPVKYNRQGRSCPFLLLLTTSLTNISISPGVCMKHQGMHVLRGQLIWAIEQHSHLSAVIQGRPKAVINAGDPSWHFAGVKLFMARQNLRVEPIEHERSNRGSYRASFQFSPLQGVHHRRSDALRMEGDLDTTQWPDAEGPISQLHMQVCRPSAGRDPVGCTFRSAMDRTSHSRKTYFNY